jgi:hypothetical protein
MDEVAEIDAFLESDCPYRYGIWRGFLASRLTAFNDHRDILCEPRAMRSEIAARFVAEPLPVHEMIMQGINSFPALHCNGKEAYRLRLATILEQLLET